MIRVESLTRLAALPAYKPLFVASVLVGLRDSMAEPYVVLFAIDDAHLSPLAMGAFLTTRAIGAVVFGMAFGVWLDRRPSLMPLTLALLMGVGGWLLLARTTSLWPLLLIAGIPLGANGAAFPQLFALAKDHLGGAPGGVAERGIAVMRASFSAAWAIGPLLGAILVEARDFSTVFYASALFGAGAFATLAISGMRAPQVSRRPEGPGGGLGAGLAIGITAAGFTLFFAALVMGSVALPVVITGDLHGPKSDIGLTMGLCAFLEVPVMIAVALRPALLGGYGALVGGFLAMILYFLAVAVTPSLEAIILAQGLRAIGIGLVTCVGISYMQDLVPNRAGAATALFTITNQVGALVAGIGAGAWANAFGYHTMFLACAALTLVGLLLLGLGARPVRPGLAAVGE